MDTVLCVDTSGSMSGRSLTELKSAVNVFLEFAARTGLGERVALVEFGNNTRRVTPLTNNYGVVARAAGALTAGGGTPMAAGLIIALKEIAESGNVTTIAGTVRLNPRIILMTDGAPDSKDQVAHAAAACATLGIAVACVGVTGCDKGLLSAVASATGGMFTMADKVEGLSTFFLRQVMLSMFIAQFARDMALLYSLEQLRRFMYEQTGEILSDGELQALLYLIQTMTKGSPGGGGGQRTGGGGGPRALPSSRATGPTKPGPKGKGGCSGALLAFGAFVGQYLLRCL